MVSPRSTRWRFAGVPGLLIAVSLTAAACERASEPSAPNVAAPQANKPAAFPLDVTTLTVSVVDSHGTAMPGLPVQLIGQKADDGSYGLYAIATTGTTGSAVFEVPYGKDAWFCGWTTPVKVFDEIADSYGDGGTLVAPFDFSFGVTPPGLAPEEGAAVTAGIDASAAANKASLLKYCGTSASPVPTAIQVKNKTAVTTVLTLAGVSAHPKATVQLASWSGAVSTVTGASIFAWLVEPLETKGAATTDRPWWFDTARGSFDAPTFAGFLHGVAQINAATSFQLPAPAGDGEYFVEVLYPGENGSDEFGSAEAFYQVITFHHAAGASHVLGSGATFLEPLTCSIQAAEDAPNDGKTIDITTVHYGWSADVLSLSPDLTRFSAWFEARVSAASSMRYTSRTRQDGSPGTLQLFKDFTVNANGTCSAPLDGTAGTSGETAYVFCAPYTKDGAQWTRITIAEVGVQPGEHTFSIKGGGEFGPDASRSDANAAYIVGSLPDSSCPAANDPRFDVTGAGI